jgi:methylenetetrahydrofolate dehydrogenase (NADP+)/methenyltetrahydrofolate cyclohydrolase
MIIDGRALAKEVLARTKTRANKLPKPPYVVAIVENETPATLSYLAIKKRYAEDAGCLFYTAKRGTSFAVADAVLIQLPLPDNVDTKKELDKIPLEKDADVLSSAARAKFEQGDASALLPPVVAAIREIFTKWKINAKSKRAVVIGNGWLVGKPSALWLKKQGAEVSVLTSKSDTLSAALRAADIIVSGAGSPHLIKPDMLKPGVVLIDAATTESNGVITGDADPACAPVASLFTPVPGGVGPLAVAMLFENAVTLAERALRIQIGLTDT